MSTVRPVPLRRTLGPIGAMIALGLTAGFLIGQDIVRADADDTSPGPRSGAPSSAVQALEHQERQGLRVVRRATTSDGAEPGAEPGTLEAVAEDGLEVQEAGQEWVTAEFRFLLRQPDRESPIRWDPCRPLRYKVALGPGVPTSEIAAVRSAFDAAGTALGGVELVYDGTTAVVPDVVDGSSKAATDIVFAFARSGPGPEGSDLLTGWEAGRGGLAATTVTGADGVVRQQPTHGSVVVDIDKWKVMSRHDRAVLYLHEIGHAIGLDHPQDDRQIMSSGAYDLPARYQAGDLAGLALLGRSAGCLS